MRTYYRLIFKDGTHSAWNRDYEFVKENAEFFGAEIETWVVGA